MRALISLLALITLAPAFAGDGGTAHRYIIERTFPAGALDGLDAAAKKKVNDNNATAGVSWLRSYANADQTKTYCVYEGPNEAAIRKAAALNKLPVDRVTEVPVQVDARPVTSASTPSAQMHRFVVQRTFPSGALDEIAKGKTKDTNSRFQVRWVTSYANAEKTKTYSIYEAPNEAAVRSAALATGAPVETIEEVPVTLLPN